MSVRRATVAARRPLPLLLIKCGGATSESPGRARGNRVCPTGPSPPAPPRVGRRSAVRPSMPHRRWL